MKINNIFFPPNSITFPLHAQAVTKVVTATSTLSHCNTSLGYDCHIVPFVDVEAEEYIKHVNDKRRRREWKRIGVVTKLLSMVLH